MGAEKLTTLTAVKEWLGITTDDSDALLERLIDAASRFALQFMNRPTLLRATYTQRVKGNGKNSLMLGNWPIISITSVGIGGASIPASTFSGATPSSGYVLSEDRPGYRTLDFYGYGYGFAEVVYVAGFETTETDIIPATPHEITPTTGGVWTVDRGVTIDGVAATKVASGPTTGQYAVDAAGKYTFAAADADKTAVIYYGYVPYDISFAVTEIVGAWMKRKDRIGVLSKTLGGQETVVFDNSDITTVARSSLQPYVNVVPL